MDMFEQLLKRRDPLFAPGEVLGFGRLAGWACFSFACHDGFCLRRLEEGVVCDKRYVVMRVMIQATE
jgi:hypothetical protein